jgi:hypothetical protein
MWFEAGFPFQGKPFEGKELLYPCRASKKREIYDAACRIQYEENGMSGNGKNPDFRCSRHCGQTKEKEECQYP